MNIPFNKIYYGEEEIEAVIDSLKRGQISADGYYTREVERLLEKKLKAFKVITTTSCTHALEMACILSGLKSGDEVIIPSFTFPSTANAVLITGATPVFTEIEEKTLNIDVNNIEKNINEKTRAIILVHYGGISCDMDKIKDLAKKYNLIIIEDAAQALGGKYKDEYLGTIGDFGCFSFHQTKNFICGEGGALLINRDDEEKLNKAMILRQKGTNRDKFIKGQVDKYNWVEYGSSYAPSDMLMAFLFAQLNKIDEITEKRRNICSFYKNEIDKDLKAKIVSYFNVPDYCSSNYHLFYILLENEDIRDKVIDRLKEKEIEAYFHYLPLHSSPMGISLGYKAGDLKITERVSSSLLRLPLYNEMTIDEASKVMEALKEVL
jgi:dTDP-4-amino-4,6-dideoxygalactose transaminase